MILPRLLRRGYGASVRHLLGHLSAFAIAAFALEQIFSGGYVVEIVVFFVGLVVLHDLVLVPLYGAADRMLVHRHGTGGRTRPPGGVSVINHIRAPVIISAILLIVYAPLIVGLSGRAYRVNTGHPLLHYLRNWVLITAGLLLASAAVWALRVLRGRRAARASGAVGT